MTCEPNEPGRDERPSRFAGDLDEVIVVRPEDQTLAPAESAALETLVYGDR